MNKLILPLLMYKETGSQRKGNKKASFVVPSWNHLYTIIRNRPILDKWALQHKAAIKRLAEEWKKENNWEKTENKKIFVDIWIYWNDARLKDCHNIDKIILDTFEEAEIFDNDANALVRYQDFSIDIEKPRVEIAFSIGEDIDRAALVKVQKKKIKNNAKKLDL